MLKKFLLSVIALVVCSTGVFAQDVFVTFGQGVNVGNTSATFNGAGSGTGFIFVRRGFDFDGFQVDLVASNNAVAQITSATVVNSDINLPILGTPGLDPIIRFNNADVDLNANGVLDNGETGDINSIPGFIDASGVASFLAFSINQTGIDSRVATSDTGFDVDADAFLLGTFDFDIVGNGTTTFVLEVPVDVFGQPGFFTIPKGVELSPVFGEATLTATGVAVPEPSSTVLLALGLAALAARRRR